MTFKGALSKLELKPPAARAHYQYLISVREQRNMCTFEDFLRWYKNKDVVPTLEAMQRWLICTTKRKLAC